MGDEVKITVIATGFRQGSAERREHLLTAALRETAAPRIEKRPATPRFASEEQDEPAASASRETPVLIPVTARDFVSAFRVHEADPAGEAPAAHDDAGAEEDTELVGVAVSSAHPDDTAMPHPAFVEEANENLDIPAFMRKGAF